MIAWRPKRYDPRATFPEEVVRLHDEHGVPWPNWYCGPLNTASPDDVERAVKLLSNVRRDARRPL